MKKKMLSITLIFVLILSVSLTSAFAESPSKSSVQLVPMSMTLTDNRNADSDGTGSSQSGQANSAAGIDGIYYARETSYYTYCYAIVTNNSDQTVEITGNATAKDAAGNTIGAAKITIDVLAPGETTIGSFSFKDVKNAADFDVSYYTSSTRYQPVIKNLTLETSENTKNVVATVTNNGNYSAKYVRAYALFCDANDQLLDADDAYITDNDNEIKPGMSLSATLSSSTVYDHVYVCLAGRADGTTKQLSNLVSDADFIFEEYLAPSSSSYSYWYLGVTNNSAYPVGVYVNAIAYDAAGHALGAGKDTISVIGAGQSSIATLSFRDASSVDHIEYLTLYDDAPYYDDVLSSLVVEGSININNVILSVTNTGLKPAKFVKAYVLFLDENGAVLDVDDGYVTDSDSEIKPGATLNVQLDTKSSFSNVAVYFTGRADK